MENKRYIKSDAFQLENTYKQLPDLLFSEQMPSQVPSARLVLFNEGLAQTLGLDEDFFKSEEGLQVLSGNGVLEGTTPIAQAYAGHQFGYFTMLGDGRAVLLGEYVTEEGDRLDVQLKGSGRTPYSRRGDGKAALGPMLREYIISEGMHVLGIPTTRSLAVVTTGEIVRRETPLSGAILTRIAKSHIRVGTFQYVSQWGSLEEIKALADYTLERHFKKDINEENPYLYLLDEVVEKQAKLIAKWQLVGFIHGVMNTDNMAISGETIDYGPCAFMDTYHLETVFSSIDTEGRYAYQNQPSIGSWNLARFAETLLPLLHEDEETAIQIAKKSIARFGKLYKMHWTNGMRKKLGLFNEEAVDEHLIDALLSMMQQYKADYTNTFRDLTLNQVEGGTLYESEAFKKWHVLWQERVSRQEESKADIKQLMEKNNPHVIPRNHRVEEALKAATEKEDYSVLVSLLEAIRHPYDYTRLNEHYMTLPEVSSCPYKTYCGT